MLSGLLGGLWRAGRQSTATEESRTTAGSTHDSLDRENRLSDARVNLYKISGCEVEELLSGAELSFLQSSAGILLSVKQLQKHREEEDDEETKKKEKETEERSAVQEFKFACTDMKRVRHHQVDMFQWVMQNSADEGEDEFGLLFAKDKHAFLFEKLLLKQLCAEADCLYTAKNNGVLSVYTPEKKEWKVVASPVSVSVKQRPHTFEGYLMVRSSKSNKSKSSCSSPSSAISVESEWILPLSYNEFIDADSAKNELQWWGVGAFSQFSNEEEAEAEASEEDEESEKDNMCKKQLFCLQFSSKESGTASSESTTTIEGTPTVKTPQVGKTTRRKSNDGFIDVNRKEDEAEVAADCAELAMTEFFLLIRKVMLEGAEGRKIDPSATHSIREMKLSLGYDDEAFDKSLTEDEESKEAMEWEDAESEERTDEENETSIPLIPRDPSREVWRTSPNAMLYRDMKVGRERTFVFRQNATHTNRRSDMQIFGFDDVGKTRIVATIDNDKFHYGRDHVHPSSALLHDAEQKLVLVGADRDDVYMMDVERERIVQKWETGSLPISGVIAARKYGERRSENTAVAFSPQSLFYLDFRKSDKNARTNTLSYLSKTNFTCAATDGSGHIAVGSANGDLRLYDGKVNYEGNIKKAKNRLRGLGHPLLHLAVLKDGSWILGTCQTYLLLYPVRLLKNDNDNKTGFMTVLGQQQQPQPIVLRLLLEDLIAYNLQNLSFSKAEFDEEEDTIVTFTNNLVVIWDFLAVKKGNLFAYSIRKISDYIKDAAFASTQFGERVVMATPSSLSTKTLKRISK